MDPRRTIPFRLTNRDSMASITVCYGVEEDILVKEYFMRIMTLGDLKS